MKKVFEFCLIMLIAFGLAYAFNFFFLDLTEQSQIDQAALLFFLTCPLVYVFYIIWNQRTDLKVRIIFDFSINKKSFLDNLTGISLSLFFFSVYLYFSLWLNEMKTGQVDNLFDADINSWMRRISAPDVQDFPMRGPHPFTYLILRPFGYVLNLITNNPPLSAMILNAGIGALCVFLAWLFIKRQFHSKVYAFLIAALLGLSTSHLFFGIVVETYIFSALALILFFLFLQSNNQSIVSIVFASVLTFGITLTNFVQNMIGFMVARPRLKEIMRFTLGVLSISLLLSFLHAALYPESQLFFLLSDTQNEEKFFVNLTNMSEWRLTGWIMLVVRTLLLYAIVAPNVFILTEEVGSFFPEFRFFKISINVFHQTNYDGIGQILISVWAVAVLIAVIVFLWNLIRTKKADMSLSFALCLAFNFVLHIFYGQEPFLYSSDWAYALIFFVAFGLAPFAKNRFFQSGLLVFVLLLAFNQWQFLQSIFGTLAQFTEAL